jgi:predicted nucleic acid-binding protein
MGDLRPDVPKISSHLSTVELLRTCRRVDAGAVGNVNVLLGGIDLLPVDRAVVEQAASLVPTELRTLDAIHLASALSVKADLTALVAYDSRLCSAATASGIEVVSPA